MGVEHSLHYIDILVNYQIHCRGRERETETAKTDRGREIQRQTENERVEGVRVEK